MAQEGVFFCAALEERGQAPTEESPVGDDALGPGYFLTKLEALGRETGDNSLGSS